MYAPIAILISRRAARIEFNCSANYAMNLVQIFMLVLQQLIAENRKNSENAP